MGLLRLKVRFGMLRSTSACVREVALVAESTVSFTVRCKSPHRLHG